MDVAQILQELQQERKVLEEVLASLIELQEQRSNEGRPSKRRGRKSMSPAQRLEVSLRMRKYWGERGGIQRETAAQE